MSRRRAALLLIAAAVGIIVFYSVRWRHESRDLRESRRESAAVAQGTRLINRLQFRPAEELLEATVRRGGGHESRRALERLYRLESRIDDVRALIREGWKTSQDPAADLKTLWELDTAPWPIEAPHDPA